MVIIEDVETSPWDDGRSLGRWKGVSEITRCGSSTVGKGMGLKDGKLDL